MKSQVVDVVTSVLFAPEDPNAVLREMVAETTRIVSLTITEKGYCRGGGDTALDFDHPDIKHDLQNPAPKSAPGFLLRALEMRRRRGLRPFTVLSLDNLPANGKLTRQIVCELAVQIDPDLAHWIEKECKFPCTMVDRIVPAGTILSTIVHGNLHSFSIQCARSGSIWTANSHTIWRVNFPFAGKLSKERTVKGRSPRRLLISRARSRKPGADFGAGFCRSCLISGWSKSSAVSPPPRQYPFSVIVRLTIRVVSATISRRTAFGSSGAKRTDVTTSTT